MQRILLSGLLLTSSCSLLIDDTANTECSDAFQGVVSFVELTGVSAADRTMHELGKRRFDAEGSLAALLSADDQVAFIDLSDPLLPQPIGDPRAPAGLRIDSLAVGAGRVHVVGEKNGFELAVASFGFDELDPPQFQFSSGSGTALVSAGGCAFAAGFGSDVVAWPVESQTAPVPSTAMTDVLFDHGGHGVIGGRAARTTGPPDCQIETGASIFAIQGDDLRSVFGTTGVILDGQSVSARDIALMGSGDTVFSVDLGRGVTDAQVLDDHLFVATGRDLAVYGLAGGTPTAERTVGLPGRVLALRPFTHNEQPYVYALVYLNPVEADAYYALAVINPAPDCAP